MNVEAELEMELEKRQIQLIALIGPNYQLRKNDYRVVFLKSEIRRILEQLRNL